MFEPRWYRNITNTGRFITFQVQWLETDLWIGIDPKNFSDRIPTFILNEIKYLREVLDNYIDGNKDFKDSLVPISTDNSAPVEIRKMIEVSTIAGIGPMSAVAGLFAGYIGKKVQETFNTDEIIIENGGDLFISVKNDIDILVYAGNSPLSNKIAVTIPYHLSPIGLCTSSGTVGHSLSFGKADAVMIACNDTALADSLATRFCNEVKTPLDIENVLKLSESYPELLSILVILEDTMGIRGCLKIKPYIQTNETQDPPPYTIETAT